MPALRTSVPGATRRSSRRTVLLTGFEPFGGDVRNPSAEIVAALQGRIIRGRRVVGVVLPCAFTTSTATLRRLLREHRPELVLATGLAGGRAGLSVERIAINVQDARIPDNAGAQPIDRPVVRGGPAAYWSTLPVKAIVARLRREGLPADVSQTAGTFVCNHVFYFLMHALRRRRGVRGGFVHVPWLPEQAEPGGPAMPLATVATAIAAAIETALTVRRDLRTSGGATQ
ncbi:MAG: pyroglutamyl-peptidase I [Opitutaceae bacterium]|nr:pyroglutamyl-peptidase I [Opitutaceae bacterium]